AVGGAQTRGRRPGRERQLERPHGAPHVVRVDAPRRLGIALGQAAVQAVRVARARRLLRLALELLAQARPRGAIVDQTLEEGADVEAGSPGEEDDAPARVDRRGGGTRLARVAAGV